MKKENISFLKHKVKDTDQELSKLHKKLNKKPDHINLQKIIEEQKDDIDFEPKYVLLWRIIDAIIIEEANPSILNQQQHYIRDQARELLEKYQEIIFKKETDRLFPNKKSKSE